MQPLIIPCPQCGSNLKLRDPSLLGKTGICPGCDFRFVLEQAQEVELELVKPPWEQSSSPEVSEDFTPTAPEPSPVPTDFLDIVSSHDQSGTKRLQELRNKGRRTRPAIIATLLVLIATGGILYLVVETDQDPNAEVGRNNPALKQPAAEPPVKNIPIVAEALHRGQPIDLQYLPHGVGLVIHLHPAQLWRADSAGNAARAGLPQELSDWLTTKITSIAQFPPTDIEKLTICGIYDTPGQTVKIAGVVTLLSPVKRTSLIKRFQGVRRDDIGRSYYVGAESSYLIIDERSFAFCPTSLVEDWRETIKHPATTRESLHQILRETDRDDQFTVVFDPADFRLHGETLFPNSAQRLLRSVLGWIHEDVETVAWGVRFGKKFRSRIVLRKRTSFGARGLEKKIARILETTPQRIYQEVALLNPPRLGPKRVIGRFPAMTLAYQRGTRIRREQENIVLETTLPSVAAANFTVATTLTWRELTRMSATAISPDAVAATAKPHPKSIAARLQTKIDCDFRRTPLYEALEYIGKEIGVEFELMGDDLKLIGVTQNMTQEFKRDHTPAIVILDRILTKIELVIVIDPLRNIVKVTSAKAAQERNETPVPLKSK